MHRRRLTRPSQDGCVLSPLPCITGILTFESVQGSWGGTGTKKAASKPFLIKKVAGINPRTREDYGKAHVIISEKRDKKAAKYTVKDLPYPYTSKAQHERSLQTPIGTEWNTRLGFQRGTLPRVVKKVPPSSFSRFCKFALLIPVPSLVLLSNLWSRCREVFSLEGCRIPGSLRIHTGPYVFSIHDYNIAYSTDAIMQPRGIMIPGPQKHYVWEKVWITNVRNTKDGVDERE